jgi:hypothetical protein
MVMLAELNENRDEYKQNNIAKQLLKCQIAGGPRQSQPEPPETAITALTAPTPSAMTPAATAPSAPPLILAATTRI